VTAEPVVKRSNLRVGHFYYNVMGTLLKCTELAEYNFKMYNPSSDHSSWYSYEDIGGFYQTKEQRLTLFYELVTKQAQGL
jgi:hypothetical protein